MATKPSAAQIAARKLFAERARSGAFAKKAKRKSNPSSGAGKVQRKNAMRKSTSRRSVVKHNPKRRSNTGAAPMTGEPYVVCATVLGRRQFVTGARVGSREPTLGAFTHAAYMNATRAAIVKSRLDALGHRGAQAIPVETLVANPRKRNPSTTQGRERYTSRHLSGAPRKRNPSTSTDYERAEGTRGNPRARKVTHAEVHSGSGASGLQLFHLTGTESAKATKAWRLPAKVVGSADFQAWARGMNYVCSCTLPQLRVKLARFL